MKQKIWRQHTEDNKEKYKGWNANRMVDERKIFIQSIKYVDHPYIYDLERYPDNDKYPFYLCKRCWLDNLDVTIDPDPNKQGIYIYEKGSNTGI